jgi:acyl-CoA thioesterase-1
VRSQRRDRMRAFVRFGIGAAIGVALWGVVIEAQSTSPSRSQSNSRVANVVQAVRRSYQRRPAEWRRQAAPCLHYLDETESFHNEGVAYFERASRARSSPEQSRLVRLGNDAIAERTRLIDEFWACTRRMIAGDVFGSQDRPTRTDTPPEPDRPVDPERPDDPTAPEVPDPPVRRPPTNPPQNPPGLPPGFPFPPAEAAPRRGSPTRRQPPRPVIVALGDSITEGYGLTRLQAYPAVLQGLLDSGGYRYQVMNRGVTNETSANGRARLQTALVPNTRILIVAFGLNDARAGRAIEAIRADLAAIIEEAQRGDIQVLLCGFRPTLTFSAQYEEQFRPMYRALAARYRVRLIPNLMVDVWSNDTLVQRDGFHPNAQGAEQIATLVSRHIHLMLRPNDARPPSR